MVGSKADHDVSRTRQSLPGRRFLPIRIAATDSASI
jgi:hypothetical protein